MHFLNFSKMLFILTWESFHFNLKVKKRFNWKVVKRITEIVRIFEWRQLCNFLSAITIEYGEWKFPFNSRDFASFFLKLLLLKSTTVPLEVSKFEHVQEHTKEILHWLFFHFQMYCHRYYVKKKFLKRVLY